jgi:hypothetical protein
MKKKSRPALLKLVGRLETERDSLIEAIPAMT